MKPQDDHDSRRLRDRDPDVEVDEELAFHIEERVRYYMRKGLDEAEARRAALARMGALETVRQDCVELLEENRRASIRRRWLGDLARDVRIGVRSAARSPVLTCMAILTLALGVGVNAAVFGVVKSVLLDALPYEAADRLLMIHGRPLDQPTTRSPLSSGAVADIEGRQHSFARLTAFYPTVFDVIYRPEDGVRVEKAAFVDAGFFEVMGVRPSAGRVFTRAEIEGYAFVVMLSDGFWRREFGADPAVIGRTIRRDTDIWEIVGVLPEGFVGPMGEADLWFGLNPRSGLGDPVRSRRAGSLSLIGRLNPDTDVASARRELAGIAAAMAVEHPDTDGGRTVDAVPLRDSMVGDARMALLALMASAALVLLIACANLGGALLSRTIERRGELAVRIALGAGRGRIVRQLVTETALLALAGGVAGLAVAAAGLAVVRGLAPPALPPWADLSLDTGVGLLMMGIALGAGGLIALAPLAAAGAARPQTALRERFATRGETRSGRLRGPIVAAQVTLCLSLLAGATLLSRSLLEMTSRQPGYDPEGVLTVAVKGPLPATDEARRQFFVQLETSIAALPGVIAVARTSELPRPSITRTAIAGYDRTDAVPADVPAAIVSDAYFEAMRIPVLDGRVFGPEDGLDSPPVVVVSQSLARRYWPAGDGIGARMRLGTDTLDPPALVVGIVGDVHNDPAREAAEPMVYTTSRQSLLRGIQTYVVRTAGDPLELVGPFRSQLRALDPAVPMDDAITLQALRDASVSPRRLPAVMLTAFAGLALLLACVGVYALFAALAVSREREFGIRIALGSRPSDLAALVLRQGGGWLLAGLVTGVFGALATARALRGLLFGVSPLDPLAMLIAVSVLLFFGATAMLVPIRRVLRLDPRTVMR